jgi:hypothetical protein
MAQRGEVVTDGIEYPTAPSEEQTTAGPHSSFASLSKHERVQLRHI